MGEIANVEEMIALIMRLLLKGNVVMLEDGGISHVERPENDDLVIHFEDGEPTRFTTIKTLEKLEEIHLN